MVNYNTRKTQYIWSLLITVVFCAYSSIATAQMDDLLDDDILNSEQIDVDGSYTVKRKSAADRIAALRKKLEKQNEDMVHKKIEDIRISEEQKLARKLKKAFSQGNFGQDEVRVQAAAPQRVVAPMPVEEPTKEKNNKVIPYAGVSSFNGDNVDYESNINVGLAFESMVTPRIAIGVGVNYIGMDISTNPADYGYPTTYVSNNIVDTIGYKSLNFNINSKFFITRDTMVRPFVGAAVGYNRTSLKYTERNSDPFRQNNNPYSQYRNNNPQVSTSNVTGTGMVGGEVVFTDSFGMILDFRYTKALTDGFERDNTVYNTYNPNNPDPAEQNLKNYGADIENSDIFAINLGVVVKF